MANLKDAVMGSRYMGCYIGAPGSGKTVEAVSVCEDEPDARVWLIDLDGRWRPILKMHPKRVASGAIEHDFYGPNEFEKLARKMEGLQDRCDYDAVIFDGLTSAGDQLINYMLSLRGAGDKDAKGKKKGVLEMAGPEDFGGEARGLGIILDIARVLPCHFILTAHYIRTVSVDITTRRETVQTQMVTAGKKIAAKVPAYFDEIYFFETQSSMNVSEPPKYTVRTAGGPETLCKTALPLPVLMDISRKGPDEPGLWTKIQAELKVHNLKLEREKKVVKL